MKNKLVINAIIITALLSSCGVSKEEHIKLKSEYDELLAEIESLKVIIDEFENGEQRLIALVNSNYEKRNYSEAIQNIKKLKEKHPESIKNIEFESLLVTINNELEKEKKRIEEEEKEKFRLANLNNTGIWSNSFYVDEFGQRTKEGYITNRSSIKGFFSNSATTNSDLLVDILIDNSNRISFMLYEYAGKNPVKAYGSTNYKVLVLDNEGARHNLNATNYSDRLRLDASSSRKLHNIFMKGGKVQFSIQETRNSINVYNFVVSNADFYDNAYRKLTEK